MLGDNGASGVAGASGRCAKVELQRELDLVVLGSGGPTARGRAASSYLLAIDGKPRILVDAGPGAFARLGETGLRADDLDTYLLTHLHIDHAGEVAGLVKSRDLSAGHAVSFRIVGPVGRGDYPSTSSFVARLFGNGGAFAYLPRFSNTLTIAPTDLPIDLDAGPRLVFTDGDVRVSTVAVDHGDTPTVAYRIERAGHSVVISGDLASRHTRIIDLARNASVLVYDASVLDPPGSRPILYELHTPPKRLGEVAAAAGVRTVILSHITPDVDAHREQVLASVRASFHGRSASPRTACTCPSTANRAEKTARSPQASLVLMCCMTARAPCFEVLERGANSRSSPMEEDALIHFADLENGTCLAGVEPFEVAQCQHRLLRRRQLTERSPGRWPFRDSCQGFPAAATPLQLRAV